MAKPRLAPEEKQRRQAERIKAYAEANQDAIRAYQAAYRAARKDAARIYNAAYRAANADALAAAAAERRAANPDQAKAYGREYYQKNPEKFALHRHERRARVAKVGGKLSPGITAKLMKLQKGKCINCRTSLKKCGSHVDHVVPIARGGTNTDDNVQLLCPSCNFKKHAKDPIAWAQQNGRLL